MRLYQLAMATVRLHNKLPQIQWHTLYNKHLILMFMGPPVSCDVGRSAPPFQAWFFIADWAGVCSLYKHFGIQAEGAEAAQRKFWSGQRRSTGHLSSSCVMNANIPLAKDCHTTPVIKGQLVDSANLEVKSSLRSQNEKIHFSHGDRGREWILSAII